MTDGYGGRRPPAGWEDDRAYGSGGALAGEGSYAHLAGTRSEPYHHDPYEDGGGAGEHYAPGEHYRSDEHYPEDDHANSWADEEGYPEDADYLEEEDYSEHGGHVDEYGRWVYDGDLHDGRDGYRGGPGGRAGHARRRPSRRRHPVLTVVAALFAVFVLVVVGLFFHFEGEISPSGHPGKLVSVTIPAGASSAEIGSILAKAGVIHGSSLFRYYVKLKGAGPLLPGTYSLAVNEKYDQAIAALSAGPPLVVERLVIPEGFTMQQIAARIASLPKLGLSAPKFLAAASSGQVRSPYEPSGVNNLEGLVFPATYEIKQGMSETDVLQSLVDRFDQEATSLNLTQAAATLKMTPYQVITVASIVEREAKLDVDRGPVASAIYNRLRIGKPLGADSTLVYALRQSNPAISVNSINYNQPNPYNTRLNRGLPPTPIANPGVPSLTAAAAPPATNYLYFVETNPDGKLSFASTDTGFAHLEAQCRAANLC
ncbi:endolytic transglycosylase MltG [Acidiferrimicrobium sp. IK]|uniref:endolytic transglycosylase MltG n=1 Tax=Acidiferrimicrobium sp. IK TaxID=2871700 RepID=UPI0021CB2B7E|nr:endolytic transglycosylase MltG [Acidiferrimicrobium sp. IK]MCU4184837.1 endolytic transglycosylase MltG [Acidiferrimicrobium sp. IK]